MDKLPIYRFYVPEEDEEIGVSAVALVDYPAIELNWQAFKSQFVVEPKANESEDEFIGRCISVEVGNGYDQEQAAAICYTKWDKKEFAEIEQDKLSTEIKIIRDSIKVDEFWRFNKQGNIELIPFRFKLYIEHLQYFKYYPNEKSKTFLFIKKFDRFVDILTEFQIKDDVLSRLIANQKIDAFDCVADQTRVFSNNYLSMIDTANITIKRDTHDFAMLYYQNLAVKVYKDKIEKIDYSEFTDFVWKNTVIERDFVDVDHHESQFRSFIRLKFSG